MTEVTKTEISVNPIVTNLLSGTSRRRAQIIVRCTSAATSGTLNLATYVPSLAGIETIKNQLDGAVNGTANTWSATTITYAGHYGSGVWVQDIIGYFT